MRNLSTCLLALGGMFAAGQAFASAPDEGPAVAMTPAVVVNAPLQIHREESVMACVERGGEPQCTIEVRIEVANPTAEPVNLHASTFAHGSASSDIVLTSPARPSGRPQDERPFWVDPSQSIELRLSARVVPPRVDTGDRLAPLLVRHILLAKPPQRVYGICFETAMTISGPSSQRTPGAHSMSAAIRHPATWEVDAPYAARWPVASPLPGSMERKWRGQRVDAPCIRFAFRTGWPQIGGPFIGAGVNAEKELRFKLRAGFEMAAPAWLIYSLSADTDFRRAVIAPAVEAALPGYWYLSWALGLGIPVRVYDTFDAGVRVQAALHAPVVGVVATVDLFPGLLRDVPSSVQYGVYGQLSF